MLEHGTWGHCEMLEDQTRPSETNSQKQGKLLWKMHIVWCWKAYAYVLNQICYLFGITEG